METHLFTLTDEHKMIQQAARDFALNEIVPIAPEFDESGEFPRKTVAAMGEMGFSLKVFCRMCGLEAIIAMQPKEIQLPTTAGMVLIFQAPTSEELELVKIVFLAIPVWPLICLRTGLRPMMPVTPTAEQIPN